MITIPIIAAACLMIGGGTLALFGLKQVYNVRQLMKRLDTSLEAAIAGKAVTTHFDEAHVSRIEENLQRFLAIQQAQARKSHSEKHKIKELIANISHQTKTPLANIILYNQLIQETNKESRIQDYTKEIAQQSEKMQFFIERLMKTAYLEDDLIQLTKTEQAIQPLLEQAVDAVTPASKKKQIALKLEVTPLVGLYDFRWTLEAVVNILDNAIKYSPSDTKILIFCESYESFLKITISDEGPGIPEKEQAQIFERFYRGAAARQAEGLGIGLFLVREIISGQGGFIKVSTNDKQGACFSLFLPK